MTINWTYDHAERGWAAEVDGQRVASIGDNGYFYVRGNPNPTMFTRSIEGPARSVEEAKEIVLAILEIQLKFS